jgi:parallel beta-helix repeat protein
VIKRFVTILVVATPVLAALFLAGVVSARAAKSIVVEPGQSIQAAVDLASPGDTILVEPGTYIEAGRPCPTEPTVTCAVVVKKDNIALIGQESQAHPVILQSNGSQDQGFAVAKTDDPGCLSDPSERIEGSLISGFTVQGFAGSGILLYCADDWRVTAVTAVDNYEYGIFPSHSGPGRVDHSFATGSNDTGIYVGDSHGARIDHNTASGNVSGFEIENSTGVRDDHNLATDNTAGILSFALPFLDIKTNANNQIDHNTVTDNNKPNTCPPGDDVCSVPVGTGILLVAADTNTVDHNTVTGNNSFGIGLANFCVVNHVPPAVCASLDIDPNSNGNQLVHNFATSNGLAPDPIIAPLPGADLLWDGTGTGNCWQDNTADAIFPAPLPACS